MVKCFICKKVIDKKESKNYLEEGKKTPKYFCSDIHLQVHIHNLNEKELKKLETNKFNEVDLYVAIEILQYELGQITPPSLKKRIQKLNKNYSYDVIKLCFEMLKPQLNSVINNKEFNGESHMVNYIMVAVENNINDTYRVWKRRKEMLDKSIKLEEDLSIFNSHHESVNREVKKSKSKDISSFLMEDEL